jgi:hypothetical protein
MNYEIVGNCMIAIGLSGIILSATMMTVGYTTENAWKSKK